MFKRLSIAALTFALGAPAAAFGLDLRNLAGCKPGADDAIVTYDGLFTVHRVCDHVLAEIPDRVYGHELLFNTEFAGISAGSELFAPGTVVDNRVVRLVRRGLKIYVEEIRYDVASKMEPGIERAVEESTLHNVIRAFDIVGRGRRGEAVIDLTTLFVTDPPKSFALGFMKHFGMKEIDTRRSYIDEVNVYPDNVGIRFYQTWVADRAELAKRVDVGQETVTSSLGFLFYTNLYMLPVKPMRARYFDDRVGYFASSFRDYGSGDSGGVERGYINRFRLEKKDPAAPVSEPVKPIVFFITSSVPEVWRPYIKQGVEDWQPVFEKAGFRKAILARDAPTEDEDPTFDPDDVRFNVIRWAPSGRRNALGAAVIDPRSGEVISSHTILWNDILRLVETWYFTQASPLDPRAQKLPLQPELMGELLRYIVRHEIGHALGLRHNFKASSAITPKQLRDPAWTKEWGTSASTMSYARFNYVAQPGDGAGLMPELGPYDYFAIDWGYRQFDGNPMPDDERPLLDQLAARQVTDPLLRFGGEDDVGDLDPTVSSNVLCGEAISCADLGLRNIDRVMSFIVPATTRTGEPYDRLSIMYEALVQQRHRELALVTKVVGGVEETRYHAGRGKAPFVPVPPTRQFEAVKFLLDRAFVEPKALLDPEVLSRITPSGGQNPLQGSNVDLLRRLVNPGVFERMTEASIGDQRYTGVDMLYDLNKGLFSELEAKVPLITPYRRQLQRSYVTVLLAATGTIDDPSYSGRSADDEGKPATPNSRPKGGRSADSDQAVNGGAPAAPNSRLKGGRSLDSALADVGKDFTQTGGSLSEFRASLRAAVGNLLNKIEAALAKTKDTDTLLHLRLMRVQLGNVP